MSIPNLIPHKTLYISGYIYSYYAFVFIFEFPEHISKHILQFHTFLFITSRRGTDDTILNFMDNITKQNGNEVGRHQVEGQTIIINQQERRSTNGLGTAGFILALLGLIFSWVPGLGWVLWALGLIFSFVGIFRTPRGLAIAGLVISCIALIVLIILVSAIASLV